MKEISCDFIRVLSAEDTCPQCTESYAWVDQRFCVACMTAVCPDCVAPRTRAPGQAPLCRVCYSSDEEPTRPIPRTVLALRGVRRRGRAYLIDGLRASRTSGARFLRKVADELRLGGARAASALVSRGSRYGVRAASSLALHGRRGGVVLRQHGQHTLEGARRLLASTRQEGKRACREGAVVLRAFSRDAGARGRALVLHTRTWAACAALALSLLVGISRTQFHRDGR